MKKVLTTLLVAGAFAFYACGPSAEETAKMEKAKQDSMDAVNKAAADKAQAEAAAAAEKAKADSMAAAATKKPAKKK
jgi:hypothetical protein